MIDEIRVSNLALIKDATIRPSSGLTVITGETGTGKTALLSSCRLLMGQRADRALVREGEADASVQGRFFFEPSDLFDRDDPAFSSDGEIVVSRQVSSDGRSRVQINGSMASVGELSSVVSPSVSLCSQHDQQKLLKPAEQRRMLDIWIGSELDEALVDYQKAFEDAAQAAQALADIRERRSLDSASLDDARFLLSEIEALSPEAGEYEELLSTLDKSENAEALAVQSETAYQALSDEGGVLDGLNVALGALETAARYDNKLSAYAESLKEAGFIIEDISRDMASYKESMEFDPETLEQCQDRVGAYQRLMRKYGPELSDVLDKEAQAKELIEIAENADQMEKQALAEVEMTEAILADKAAIVSRIRMDSASKFSECVSNVMSSLQMGSSSLECAVEELERNHWSMSGPNRVEFMFKPSQNMQARPLSRIASGGELSRVMLSLHAVMGDKDNVSTLIFDEIDAGVGGVTAVALADVLAKLSLTHQVMVVTHLPQVAARADKHYVVDKREVKGVMETSLDDIQDDARVQELARMLSGSVTEHSVAHAKELLHV